MFQLISCVFFIGCHWFCYCCSNNFHLVLIILFTDLHWCSNDVHLFVIDFRSIFIKLSLMFHWVSLIFNRFLHRSSLDHFEAILGFDELGLAEDCGEAPGLVLAEKLAHNQSLHISGWSSQSSFWRCFFQVSIVFYWFSLIFHWLSTDSHWFAVVCFIEFHWFLIFFSMISTDVRTIFIEN